MKYQYENLLREPYEYYSGGIFLFGALSMLTMPEFMMMPTSIAYIGSGLCAVQACREYKRGYRLRRYQKQLTTLASFILSSKKIGTSYKDLWIGRGFAWDQKHTQRLLSLESPQGARYRKLPLFYRIARRFEKHNEHSRLLSWIVEFTSSQHRWNPVKPLPDAGGNPALHTVGMWEKEEDINLPLHERVGHLLVLGTTGVGKTRAAETYLAQDIRRGDVVIMIDPKGDADLLLRMYAECQATGRLEDFYIFHLGFPEISHAYNPIGNFMRMTEVASRIANQLPGEGQSAAFRDFVWGFVNTIAASLVTMGIRPTYELLKKYTDNLEPLFINYMRWFLERKAKKDWFDEVSAAQKELDKPVKEQNRHILKDWKTPKAMLAYSGETIALYKYYMEHREENESLRDGVTMLLCSKINYDKFHLDKLTASLQPFLDKMTTDKVAEMLIPNENKPSFDWNEILQKGGVIYVGLDALSDPEVAATVGNSILADLTSIAGRLYKEGANFGLPPLKKKINKKTRGYVPRIRLHADEFNEVIGDEFIPMLNKVRGAGIDVTAYTQTIPDIEARLGSKAKAKQVLGNFNSLIMMRVQETETARHLTDRLKQVEYVSAHMLSGTGDRTNINSDEVFTSTTTQRHQTRMVDQLTVHDLTSLPKGQAFASINGNKLYKARMPLPDKNDFKHVPKDIRAIAEAMRSQYQTVGHNIRFKEYLSDEVLYGRSTNQATISGQVVSDRTQRRAIEDEHISGIETVEASIEEASIDNDMQGIEE